MMFGVKAPAADLQNNCGESARVLSFGNSGFSDEAVSAA